MAHVSVSVIIPTRNRADRLAACLESLLAQTRSQRDFEVVVVDNGSTDATPEVLGHFADRLPLHVQVESEPGLHVGRHEGARIAKAEVLAFIDDDVRLQPGWVEAVINAFRKPDLALLGGNNYPEFESPPPDWLEFLWNRSAGHGRMLGSLSILDLGEGSFPIDPMWVWGCNFCLRRDVLVQAGGFHPDALPAERALYRGDGESHVSAFVARAGLLSVFDSGASVHHWVSNERMTEAYFSRRSRLQGISDSYTRIRELGRTETAFERWRRRGSGFKRYLGSGLRRRDLANGTGAARAMQVERAMYSAWSGGYAEHQSACCTDSELLTWVLRDNYWTAAQVTKPKGRKL